MTQLIEKSKPECRVASSREDTCRPLLGAALLEAPWGVIRQRLDIGRKQLEKPLELSEETAANSLGGGRSEVDNQARSQM